MTASVVNNNLDGFMEGMQGGFQRRPGGASQANSIYYGISTANIFNFLVFERICTPGPEYRKSIVELLRPEIGLFQKPAIFVFTPYRQVLKDY